MFSPLKIIVLIVIVIAVWYGFKIFARGGLPARNKSGNRSGGGAAKGASGADSASAEPPAMDMIECPVCGDYVAKGISNCGKDNCPYPGG